jgi:hypothetical protein
MRLLVLADLRCGLRQGEPPVVDGLWAAAVSAFLTLHYETELERLRQGPNCHATRLLEPFLIGRQISCHSLRSGMVVALA